MKKQFKSIFEKNNFKVLTQKERSRIKGGNSSSDSSTGNGDSTNIVIEDILQI